MASSMVRFIKLSNGFALELIRNQIESHFTTNILISSLSRSGFQYFSWKSLWSSFYSFYLFVCFFFSFNFCSFKHFQSIYFNESNRNAKRNHNDVVNKQKNKIEAK